jgi:prevent-host-death family protein
MTKNMTATEARQNFFGLLATAQTPGMAVTITHEGHPTVIVMSFEEFEGWQETLEIMSDASLMKDIRDGMRDRTVVSLEDLERKRHASAHVQGRPQRKGTKAVRKPAVKRSGKGTKRVARAS